MALLLCGVELGGQNSLPVNLERLRRFTAATTADMRLTVAGIVSTSKLLK